MLWHRSFWRDVKYKHINVADDILKKKTFICCSHKTWHGISCSKQFTWQFRAFSPNHQGLILGPIPNPKYAPFSPYFPTPQKKNPNLL